MCAQFIERVPPGDGLILYRLDDPAKGGVIGITLTGHHYEPIVATERNARSSPLMVRVFPVTVNVALERMSLELLPALTSTGPGSMTNSPDSPV